MVKIFLLIDCSSEFDRKLLRGLAQYSKESGPWLFYRLPSYYSAIHGEQGILKWAKEWKADAIIDQWDNDTIDLQKELDIPVVLQNYHHRSITYSNLTGDCKGTGRMAIQFFAKGIFHNFAYFGVKGVVWSDERCEEYRQEVKCIGGEFFSFGSDKQEDEIRMEVSQRSQQLPKPVTLSCCDDAHALFISETCKMTNISIPEEITLLGVDNDELVCNISDPPISSIELEVERDGYPIGRLTHQQIRKEYEGTFNIVINSIRIGLRQSTEKHNIKDPYILEIVKCIEPRYGSDLTIESLLVNIPLSRRNFEVKFKNVLNISIYQYILNCRCNHLADLLLTTDRPLADLAMEVGFTDHNNIARTSRKFKGCSPIEYRQKKIRQRQDKRFLKTVFRFDIKIIHENGPPLFSYLSKYILDINTMRRHTIRGKIRTIIYPITIYLGIASIMGCKRLEINQTKRNWEKLSAYLILPSLYQEKFGAYRNPLLSYNGDIVKNADDWLKRRKEVKDKWLNLIGHWPAIITNQKLEIIKTTKREGFKQHLVRFYWTPLEQTYGYLLESNKRGKHPAIITVFYEPETTIKWGGKANRDSVYQLTKRGFVTLSLGTRQITKNKTYSLYYPTINNSTIQPLSVLACAAANAQEVLAKIESVDSTQIGIMGHSCGARWAMFASCLYEKSACTAWSDPSIVFDETKDNYINYWEPQYLGYYPPPWKKIWGNNGNNSSTSVYARLCKEGHDLHELHSLLAPHPFLVSGDYSDNVDRWIPLDHSVAVNRLLGYHHRMAMTNGPKHDPTPESNEATHEFLEWFLKRKTPKED